MIAETMELGGILERVFSPTEETEILLYAGEERWIRPDGRVLHLDPSKWKFETACLQPEWTERNVSGSWRNRKL